MTPEETEKVLWACTTADSGCFSCFLGLVKELRLRLPDVDWKPAFEKVAGREFGEGWEINWEGTAP
jgi:hypothetical protein